MQRRKEKVPTPPSQLCETFFGVVVIGPTSWKSYQLTPLVEYWKRAETDEVRGPPLLEMVEVIDIEPA
jgi:hypothetical protein